MKTMDQSEIYTRGLKKTYSVYGQQAYLQFYSMKNTTKIQSQEWNS